MTGTGKSRNEILYVNPMEDAAIVSFFLVVVVVFVVVVLVVVAARSPCSDYDGDDESIESDEDRCGTKRMPPIPIACPASTSIEMVMMKLMTTTAMGTTMASRHR